MTTASPRSRKISSAQEAIRVPRASTNVPRETTKARKRAGVGDETPATYEVSGTLIDADREVLARAEAILQARMMRESDALLNPTSVIEFLKVRLGALVREEFHAIWLDTRHRALAVDCLFLGSIDGASIHPREVVRAAIKHNAAAVIFAHNHPSGVTEPSEADRLITRRLCETLSLIEVRVLDHFVIGGNAKPASLAARGWV